MKNMQISRIYYKGLKLSLIHIYRLTDFVVAGQQYDFEDNVKIKIISPNEKELEKLAKEWKEESCKKREKDILYGVDSETHYKKDLDCLLYTSSIRIRKKGCAEQKKMIS